MVKRWAPIAALLLAGCGRTDVQACEDFVKEGLRSPSSYRRIGIDVSDQAMNLNEYRQVTGDKAGDPLADPVNQSAKLGIRSVSISYDAENVYGATVRDKAICGFRMRDGKLEKDADQLRADALHRQSTEAFDRIARSGAIPSIDPATWPARPRSCCL